MIDWDHIDTVFLDMDGTLLDLHFDNHFWGKHLPGRYAQLHNLTLAQAEERLFPQMRALRGQLDWYCTRFWSRELDVPIIELKHEVGHLIALREHVQPFLDYLQRQNKHIVLFTNAHEDTLALKMEKTGIFGAFHKTVSSHALGHPKESLDAWGALMNEYDFIPARSLFIDDNFSVLDSAKAFGIGHLFGIATPDSRGKRLSHAQHTLLDSFLQIMPA